MTTVLVKLGTLEDNYVKQYMLDHKITSKADAIADILMRLREEQ